MVKAILIALSALVLAGCSTPAERAAAQQAEMDRMMAVYGPACSRLGYPANSDPWRNCVLQLSAKDDVYRYGYYPHWSLYGGRRWGGWGADW